MKPSTSILDQSFRYVPSTSASVAETWRRFGWQPVTDEERRKRRPRQAEPARHLSAPVKRIGTTTQ